MLAAQLAAANKSRDDQKGSPESLGKCGTLVLAKRALTLESLLKYVKRLNEGWGLKCL